MYAIEFQANVENGIIKIPQEHRIKFQKGVRMILLTEAENGYSSNFIDQLLRNPVKITEFTALTRDELYARN